MGPPAKAVAGPAAHAAAQLFGNDVGGEAEGADGLDVHGCRLLGVVEGLPRTSS